MRKRLLLTVFTTVLLAACGVNEVVESTAEATSTSAIETDLETETSSEPTEMTEEPIAETTVEPTTETTVEQTTTTEAIASTTSTWLTENQITITPQGAFSQTGCLYNAYTYELLDTVASPANITITETTENAPDGYKKVIATKIVDASYADEYGASTALKVWFSAFDKYTGYSFEATTGTGSRDNSFLISANGKEYDISLQYHSSGTAENSSSTIEITCPVDYDGTAFQVGPASVYDELTWSTLDMSERLYTIDELPFFGENFLYFTYTDN